MQDMTKSGRGASPVVCVPSADVERVSSRLAVYSSGKERSNMFASATVTGSCRPTCSTCTHVPAAQKGKTVRATSCKCALSASSATERATCARQELKEISPSSSTLPFRRKAAVQTPECMHAN